MANIQARNNLTSDQYQPTFDQLTAAGFQLTWVNGYEVGGNPCSQPSSNSNGGASIGRALSRPYRTAAEIYRACI